MVLRRYFRRKLSTIADFAVFLRAYYNLTSNVGWLYTQKIAVVAVCVWKKGAEFPRLKTKEGRWQTNNEHEKEKVCTMVWFL